MGQSDALIVPDYEDGGFLNPCSWSSQHGHDLIQHEIRLPTAESGFFGDGTKNFRNDSKSTVVVELFVVRFGNSHSLFDYFILKKLP